MNRAAKKHGCGRLLLAILCILLAALCIAAYIFKEEIYIVYSAFTSSEEALESEKAENDRKTQEILDKATDITMRDLTDEERQMLADGLLTYEDAMKLIMGETLAPVTSAPAPETTDVPEETTAPVSEETTAVTEPKVPVIVTEETSASTEPVVTTPAVTTSQTTTSTSSSGIETDPEKIAALKNRQNEIIAEIYLLRATYLNKIDELIKNSKAEYIALPKEKHNMSGKLEMVEKVIIPKGYALEDECDLKMDALLDELEGILKSLGSDNSLIKQIQDAYTEQKRLKKTELINTYMPK